MKTYPQSGQNPLKRRRPTSSARLFQGKDWKTTTEKDYEATEVLRSTESYTAGGLTSFSSSTSLDSLEETPLWTHPLPRREWMTAW